MIGQLKERREAITIAADRVSMRAMVERTNVRARCGVPHATAAR